ncbi:MAG: class I SAM-dependent methyltransferase [Chloroflexota bacterium]|nr:class I SAM-dependent methyltransferase [Chloroflexota bacterium]
MESAVERWQALIDARQQQMDEAYARLGRSSADFWDRRARSFHRTTKDTASTDPLFLRACEAMTPQTDVLDVGAGTGRFSLALAPLARRVIAVEPSATMLEYLHHDAQERGITNVSIVQATWQDAPGDLAADIVICSHVLYPIREIVPFLEKLRAATRQACFIYMRATHIDAATAHLWRHFHGTERCLPPGYIHAVDVLYEMGICANVEVVRFPSTQRYSSLDLAVGDLSEQLILSDDEHTRAELRKLLADWLLERDGELVPPVGEITCAILHFTS